VAEKQTKLETVNK